MYGVGIRPAVKERNCPLTLRIFAVMNMNYTLCQVVRLQNLVNILK